MLSAGLKVIKDNLNGTLEVINTNSNAAPIGMLWVVHTEDSGARTTIGIINRWTKEFSPITDLDSITVSVYDLDALVALYNEAFPKPEIWYKRLYKKFLAFYVKNKHNYEYGD